MDEFSPASQSPAANGSLADLRFDYRRGDLLERDVLADPFAQFSLWMAHARAVHAEGMDEPHAMTLATADADGRPSARTVLLKGVDGRGFTWFTNYESRKGRELQVNPHGALNFRWGALERQVVVIGPVLRVDASESDEYFRSRPLGSRIGAIVSAQSTVVSRDALVRAAAALAEQPESTIIRPPHWGGFRLSPLSIEFWQGRVSRLHDRIRFRRDGPEAPWIVERLAP